MLSHLSSPSPVETTLRVRYAETDQMGVVYHANYIIWMEVGRVEYFRSSGMRYRDIALYLTRPISEAKDVTVRTSLTEADPRMVKFEYELQGEDARSLATGYTKHVFCGRDRKPHRLPEKYYAAFGIAEGRLPTLMKV